MKVKIVVAMVVSSMLVAPFSYAASLPLHAQLVADDATGSQPATSDATTNPGAIESGNPATAPGDASTPANGAADSTTGTSDSSNTGSDEESQDQATGDSDY